MLALLPAGWVVGFVGAMIRNATGISSVTAREVLDSRGPARNDRVARYNQLLRIEEVLGDRAVYPKPDAFPVAGGST